MADTPASVDALHARLDALRASGVDRRDPVAFAYLEALARRAAGQPEAIRQPLLVKLNKLADELAARPTPSNGARPETATSPLADLLAHINQHAHEQADATQRPTAAAIAPADCLPGTVNRNFRPKSKTSAPGGAAPGPELKSVAYYRNEWSKLSTEQQLTQTLARAPENAGPMNSQHLVLRSLQVMRDLSPEYLQGFMSYIDTLIWLEQADPTKTAAGRSSAGEAEKKPRAAKRGAMKR